MLKLSELQKTEVGVKQFSKQKYFVKRFCANGTFVTNSQFITDGESFNFVPDEPILQFDDTPLSEEELKKFEAILMGMKQYDNGSVVKMFSIGKGLIAYKQFAIKIKEYVKDKAMPSRQIFRYRIRQFISFVNSTNVTKLNDLLPYAIQYIKEYLEMYITQMINSGELVNISMALGLNQYLPDRATARRLQMVLRRIRMDLSRTGTIKLINQKRMQTAYKDLFANLLTGIETKIRDPMKRELIDAVISGITADDADNKDENVNSEEVA